MHKSGRSGPRFRNPAKPRRSARPKVSATPHLDRLADVERDRLRVRTALEEERLRTRATLADMCRHLCAVAAYAVQLEDALASMDDSDMQHCEVPRDHYRPLEAAPMADVERIAAPRNLLAAVNEIASRLAAVGMTERKELVLKLHADGYTTPEIAELLGITKNNASSTLSQAWDDLTRLIDEGKASVTYHD